MVQVQFIACKQIAALFIYLGKAMQQYRLLSKSSCVGKKHQEKEQGRGLFHKLKR